MKLIFLTQETERTDELSMQQTLGEGLLARGHEVTFATEGLPLRWRASSCDWLHVDELSRLDLDPYDVVIAGSAEAAAGLDRPFALFCGGGKGIAPGGEPAVVLTTSESVAAELSSKGRRFLSFAPVVEESWFGDGGKTQHELLRILIPGDWHDEASGVDAAYGAATHARWSGAEFEIVRLSQWSPSREEPLEHVAEFVVASTEEIARAAIRSCDIVVDTVREASRFSLRSAESMASGLAPLFSSIGDYVRLDRPLDYALFATPDDPEEAGDRLLELIGDEPLRWRVSRRAMAVAERFHPARVAEAVERFLLT